MLQKASMLVFVLASIACFVGCGTTANHYVYATIPAANQLAAFREDPNSGVLTELDGSPYSVGDGAHSIVIHPSGKFLYVANPGEGANGEDDISLFDIASNGTLTEIPPRTSLGATASVPQVLIMDPAGAYLYSMNAGSNNISVFSIGSGGALTQVSNSPFSVGALPLNIQLAPSGNFLFVSTIGEETGLIEAFSVNAGQLTLVSTISSQGVNPYGLAVNPAGTYIYASNTSSANIAIFSISSTGVLADVAGSPIDDGYQAPVAMIFDPSGNFLYVANQGSNNLTVYSIASSGLPSALTTSTSTNAYATQTGPSFIVEDPNGKYLFVGNQGTSATIQPFELSSGILTGLHFYNVGNTPSSIAVLQ
ncbi:MAG: lactonase family protein [Candidatus Sulfotelmatobacter sp.]